jgi:hypothetical protein
MEVSLWFVVSIAVNFAPYENAGVLDFIPLMRWSYDHVPAKMFSAFGYIMFAYLFEWTDANW